MKRTRALNDFWASSAYWAAPAGASGRAARKARKEALVGTWTASDQERAVQRWISEANASPVMGGRVVPPQLARSLRVDQSGCGLVGLGYGFHTGASVTDSMDAAVDRLVVETLDFYAREGARARAPESAGPGAWAVATRQPSAAASQRAHASLFLTLQVQGWTHRRL